MCSVCGAPARVRACMRCVRLRPSVRVQVKVQHPTMSVRDWLFDVVITDVTHIERPSLAFVDMRVNANDYVVRSLRLVFPARAFGEYGRMANTNMDADLRPGADGHRLLAVRFVRARARCGRPLRPLVQHQGAAWQRGVQRGARRASAASGHVLQHPRCGGACCARCHTAGHIQMRHAACMRTHPNPFAGISDCSALTRLRTLAHVRAGLHERRGRGGWHRRRRAKANRRRNSRDGDPHPKTRARAHNHTHAPTR